MKHVEEPTLTLSQQGLALTGTNLLSANTVSDDVIMADFPQEVGSTQTTFFCVSLFV